MNSTKPCCLMPIDELILTNDCNNTCNHCNRTIPNDFNNCTHYFTSLAKNTLLQVKIDQLTKLADKLSIYDLFYVCFEDGAGSILIGTEMSDENGNQTPLAVWRDKYLSIALTDSEQN